MITEEYIVLKPFSGLKINDKLVYSEESGKYIFTKEESSDHAYFSSYTELSPLLAENYEKSGHLGKIEPETSSKDSDILNKIIDFINESKEKYESRNIKIKGKYDAGKIPSCMKVEHDTVYFNMMKLLNKIESIINE